MKNIQHFSDLENLRQDISTTHQLISSAEIKSKEEAAKDEYLGSVGFFERFKMFDFREKYNASSLSVREEVMNRLPAMISISPQIAFFLGADNESYQSLATNVENRYLGSNAPIMKGALGDFARSTVHPTSILKWGSRIGSAWKAMFEHIEDMERADATRNQLAATILGTYQLVEIAPKTYALKRGKWGLDCMRGAYSSAYYEIMMDVGVAENFDFERLKRSIDTSKSV